MAEPIYRLTRTQLNTALDGAIEMYLEFHDTHGQDDDQARLYGVGEILDGLDADQELAASDPTERLKLQMPDAHADLLAVCEAAEHALRSYQYGNSATDLAREIADQVAAAIAKARGTS